MTPPRLIRLPDGVIVNAAFLPSVVVGERPCRVIILEGEDAAKFREEAERFGIPIRKPPFSSN